MASLFMLLLSTVPLFPLGASVGFVLAGGSLVVVIVVFLREENGEDMEGDDAALPPRATETGIEGERSVCASV